MSVLRAVMTPPKGATTRLNDSSSRSLRHWLPPNHAPSSPLHLRLFISVLLGHRFGGKQSLQRRLVLLDKDSLARAVAGPPGLAQLLVTSGASI
jgi:hypothetical protein